MFALTLAYLNPALNNPALVDAFIRSRLFKSWIALCNGQMVKSLSSRYTLQRTIVVFIALFTT